MVPPGFSEPLHGCEKTGPTFKLDFGELGEKGGNVAIIILSVEKTMW